MVTGTTLTAIKVEEFNPSALDLISKRHRITENEYPLLVEQLWSHTHIEYLNSVRGKYKYGNMWHVTREQVQAPTQLLGCKLQCILANTFPWCTMEQIHAMDENHSLSSALLHHDSDDTQPEVAKPLITGYRLLVTLLTVIFGVSKAILSYRGQSTAPTTLDWVSGVAVTLGWSTHSFWFLTD